MPLMPHTRAIVDFLRADQAPEREMDHLETANAADRMPASDQFMFRLAMKKKRQQQMLKQMLEDAGYSDLARMATIRRENISEDENDV